MNSRIWAFAVYSVLYEAIVWGVFGWAVFYNGYSGWWILVAIIISNMQLKPKHFGIGVESEKGGREDGSKEKDIGHDEAQQNEDESLY